MTESLPARILVVDDEPEVRALLRTSFERAGFTVQEAQNGAELFAAIASGGIDLVTLDLNLDREDGLMLARRLTADSDIPIVMITGIGDPVDRVVGLELGADDYIAKPFHAREVLARVRAVLRRRQKSAGSTERRSKSAEPSYQFAGYRLDVPRRELKKIDSGPVELTTAEFNLLVIFVSHPGRVLSRDRIMDLLKGHDWSPVDRTIDNLVGRLRRKIEADADAPLLIKTVRGVGYAFTPDVSHG